MTPPNPSDAAREAARSILKQAQVAPPPPSEWGKPWGNAGLGEDDLASIIQSALDSALSAERERRVAAEEVVNAANDPTRLEREPGVVLDEISGLAGIYRTKFPKGDDHV